MKKDKLIVYRLTRAMIWKKPDELEYKCIIEIRLFKVDVF